MENDTLLLNLTTQTISIFSIKSSLNPVVWLATISACLAYGFGFLGNLLSLVVFYSQDEFRKISTGLLFLLITIANFFHLWTLTTEFLTLYNIALFGHVFFQCRLTYFIQNVSRAMSTFFMVTVAIDRLIRTEYPMLSKKICTRKNILLITMIYLIIFSLFWSFYIYPIGSVNSLTGFCNFKYTSSFAYFINYLHFPIRAILVCFIPIIIMLLANIRMLNNIRQSKRRITNGSTVGSSENTRPLPNISSSYESRLSIEAKLSIGLGFSKVGILLIIEVIYLYSKYGSTNIFPWEHYELATD
ncbi:hypothetical protein I4U23_019574 [Adineta vaga]|nr:hypothetical protein I4U23_019574 [Adineta vaga]